MWESPGRGKLIVITGPNGTGKTHFARCLSRWLDHVGHGKQWMANANVIRYMDHAYWLWSSLLDSMKSGNWNIIDDLQASCIVILDDVGSAHDPSEIGTDKLCQLLSRREKKWTILTTNVPPDSWQDKFDYRVSSRLLRNSLIVDLTGVPDFNA